MRHPSHRSLRLVAMAVLASAITAGWPAGAVTAISTAPAAASTSLPLSTTSTTSTDEANAACEQSARRNLTAPPERVSDANFTVKTAVQPRLSTDQQIVINGEGRWHDATTLRNVRFTCTVDRQTMETVGFVMRDTEPAVVKAPVSHAPPAEPDLTRLSVASCESSAALALKRRWPRVSQISFDPETRTFQQKTLESAALLGEGRALPAQGKPVTFFGFECQIDPQDGRVLRTSVTG